MRARNETLARHDPVRRRQPGRAERAHLGPVRDFPDSRDRDVRARHPVPPLGGAAPTGREPRAAAARGADRLGRRDRPNPRRPFPRHLVYRPAIGAGRRRALARHRDHRPAMVVGGALRRRQSEPNHPDRQRAPPPARNPGPDHASIERRYPQLLGAQPRRQAGLIPGRTNDISILPRQAGIYRAQCAEFCGIQHAHMALDVTVETPAAFAAWRAAALRPAAPPAGALAQAGYAYITTRECASCHAIAGTPASGQVAPDLTHIASRSSIAAGTLPMSHDNLAAWIADPQRLKPGNNMPNVPLTPQQLAAITPYLETLR